MESFNYIVLCCSMTNILLLHNLSMIECQVTPFHRYNLTFRIVVKYPESKLTARGLAADLQIVGNGLGLSWSQPTILTKDRSPDTWSIDFSFNSTSDGFVCFACSDDTLIPVGTNFEYRILTSNKQDMIGANFGLPLLPMSKTGSTFAIPNYFAYPYFFTRNGSITNVNVTSAADPFIGTRVWCYYLPASFQENTYKNTYPVAIALDLAEIFLMDAKAYLEEEVIKGHAEEIVIIGSGDYHPYIAANPDQTDRMELLTPVPGAAFACKTGTYGDACGGCIPPNKYLSREFQELMRDQCGTNVIVGGRGESYLDYAIKEVVPQIQTVTGNRMLVDRKHLGIGGCSLGGLLSCHALWTRPEVFGIGSCLDPSFYWPMKDHVTLNNGFEFLNKTLKTQTGLRLPQNVYIDVAHLTDGEDDYYYDQVGSALRAYETMATVSPDSFTADENLRFVMVEGQNHCDKSTFGRIWLWLTPFIQPAGQPKNPYSPPAPPGSGPTSLDPSSTPASVTTSSDPSSTPPTSDSTSSASKSMFKSSTSVGLGVAHLLILQVVIQLAVAHEKIRF